jgi:hypothetical protein
MLYKLTTQFERFDWWPLLWHCFKVGLCKQTFIPFNARLYQGCRAQVSTPHAHTSTICTTKLDSSGLWPTHPVCPASRCIPSGNPQDTTCAQGIVDNLLCNARAVDPTLIAPLSSLASHLSTATTVIIYTISHLVECCSSHPESTKIVCIRHATQDSQ